MTQAAVFGSEDCELTEELWASTESQKLKEFSEKVSMTTTAATTANAPPKAASKAHSEVEPLLQRVRPPTKNMVARFDIEGEAERSGGRLLGDSHSPPCAATNADASGESAAPFYSNTFGSGGGGGGTAVAAISTDIAKSGEVSTERVSPLRQPPLLALPAPLSGDTGAASTSSTRWGGGEVETAGWRGALSAVVDPEITHPERVQLIK